jgi:hypothetical protein|tara:strand:+ start:1455 stop:1628 length:174 start_codon:yes stop_codon:yes gene_type:complete
MKNLKFIISGIACLYLAWITGTGEILNYVPFADPLNEMAFCGLNLLMGFGLLACIKK